LPAGRLSRVQSWSWLDLLSDRGLLLVRSVSSAGQHEAERTSPCGSAGRGLSQLVHTASMRAWRSQV
jgi:microcompartment protein CcmK/EutM